MNIFRLLLLLLIPTLITLTSCGSDDDDSNTPVAEEDGTNTTGTTTGDTGGPGCLSTTQRNRIRGMFDRAALQSPITGRAVESFRNPDGTYDTNSYEETTIQVTKLTDNTWRSNSTFCETGGANCSTAESVFSLAGTCYTEDSIVGRITSSSTSGFTVTLNDTTQTPPLRETTTYRVPGNGRVRINSVYVQNGLRVTLFNFLENPGGGTTSTSSAASAASTAASTAASAAATTAETTAETSATDATAATSTGGETSMTSSDATAASTGGDAGVMNGL